MDKELIDKLVAKIQDDIEMLNERNLFLSGLIEKTKEALNMEDKEQ